MRSQMIRINHCLRERCRCFLRQVVADAAIDLAELVFAGEAFGVVLGQRVRRAVGVALQGDGRYTNGRRLGEFLLQRRVVGFAEDQAQAPALVDHRDGAVIRVL